MSRLALDWVKKNFTFSRDISSLEKEFVDGVLLLGILKQRGLLSDEDAINESGTPFAALENLKLARKKLKSYNIFMDKKIIANVSSVF
jgi:hypothetical protein